MALLNLLQPRHRHSDPAVRREAVKRLDDEETLVRLASSDPDLEVRLLAVDRIGSQEGLTAVAIDGEYLESRLKAVRRIGDPQTLAGIMRERKQPELMMTCFEGIRDQETLVEIARDPRQSITARRIAINMFADQDLLLEVLRSVREPGLRRAAIGRVKDPGLRRQLESELEEERRAGRIDRVLDAYDPDVVVEMLGAFRDSTAAVQALGTLAARGGSAGARAVEILTRQLRHARAEVRLAALRRLAEAGALPVDAVEPLAGEDPDPRVRKEAAALLSTQLEKA